MKGCIIRRGASSDFKKMRSRSRLIRVEQAHSASLKRLSGGDSQCSGRNLGDARPGTGMVEREMWGFWNKGTLKVNIWPLKCPPYAYMQVKQLTFILSATNWKQKQAGTYPKIQICLGRTKASSSLVWNVEALGWMTSILATHFKASLQSTRSP